MCLQHFVPMVEDEVKLALCNGEIVRNYCTFLDFLVLPYININIIYYDIFY